MAYCKKCGAYMPDDVKKCFACGYNEAEEAASAAKEQAAQAQQTAKAARQTESDTTYHFRNDDEHYREQLEENRRRQQEQNRKWAEQEYARRKAAEEQSARAGAQRSSESRSYSAASSGGSQGMSSAMLWSILSYVSVLCLIPYLTKKGGEEADYHARQGLRLLIFSAVADAVGKLFLIGWALQATRVVLMLIGIFNAVNGRRKPLPIIGTIGPH